MRETLSTYRSQWWELRLVNWGLWKAGQGTGAGSATEGTYGGDCPLPPLPLVGEAFDTDRLVTRLEMRLFDALIARYKWSGTIELRAADLGIHRNTLTNRVEEAKQRLESLRLTAELEAAEVAGGNRGNCSLMAELPA